MRFVVSGANGFVGSNFTALLSESGEDQVLGLVRSAIVRPEYRQTDYSRESLQQILEDFKPDAFIHAAGSASVAKSIASPELDHASSVGMVETILDTFQKIKLKPRLLYLSSAAVYGNPVRLPVKESDSLDPISPYGAHRLQCEKLVHAYGIENHVQSLIVRAFSLFGPAQKQLVLWEIAKQALLSDSITLQGTGLEERDFLHVQEFVRRSLNVLKMAGPTNLSVNIASGKSMAIRTLAEQFLQALKIEKKIVSQNKPQTGNPTNWCADISLYQTLTKDFATPNFSKDLKACLDVWKQEIA